MASTGRAAPSSLGPRHSSPPRPPSFPPSDKTGFQRGAEGAPGLPRQIGEHVRRVPRCCRVSGRCSRDPPGPSYLSVGRGQCGKVDLGNLGYHCDLKGFSPVCCRWCSAQPLGCTGRTGAAIMSAACRSRVGEHLSRKLPIIVPRLFSGY